MSAPELASAVDTVLAYHQRTKHHFQRYAESLGYLDWESQPDPFRRYAGTRVFELPVDDEDASPPYEALYGVPLDPSPLSVETLAHFFRNALAISNSKSFQGEGWKLRCNPSSGNLHPTEGYAVLPPLDGLSGAAGVYHYAPNEHALEQRCAFGAEDFRQLVTAFPGGAFLAGLSSIHWREAWKYGERAYRYCNHDVGHALGAYAYAAAALGWTCLPLDALSTEALGMLLGVDRAEDFVGSEPEFPDLVVAVIPNGIQDSTPNALPTEPLETIAAGTWRGSANRLSEDHVEWDVIDEASVASVKPDTPTQQLCIAVPEVEDAAFGHPAPRTARRIIQQRRSAVAMDGKTSIAATTFFTMLSRTLPQEGRGPWAVCPNAPAIHLGLFVHRVDDVAPGLYCLPRSENALPALQEAMRDDFAWERPGKCPESLPLYRLADGDLRARAAQVSCLQQIAGAGAFSLGMLAEFEEPIRADGAWRYPRLFWEAGLVGQVLYLEAEAAGVRATGIGCYFDDPVHDQFGLQGRAYQSLYHFTVGGAVDDDRLTSDPPYTAERCARSGWVPPTVEEH